jgi:3',5'-cyclic AMP phosphodiesterase CpdA
MRIALIGDFHYSRMHHDSEELVKAKEQAYRYMMQAFLDQEADFHISIGDLTHEGVPEELEQIVEWMDYGGRQFIHVLGNHDTYSIPKADILAITGQERYRVIDTEDVMLLILDTTQEMNPSDWGGTLDAEQLVWLHQQLERSGDKPVFVFGHHPVHDTTMRSTMDMLSIHPRVDVKSVLHRKAEGGFYFCGHNHVNSLVRQAGWHYIQTAACLDVPAFRIIEVKDGEVSMDYVRMDDPQLNEDIACFYTRMPGFGPTASALGEEADLRLVTQRLKAAR